MRFMCYRWKEYIQIQIHLKIQLQILQIWGMRGGDLTSVVVMCHMWKQGGATLQIKEHHLPTKYQQNLSALGRGSNGKVI